VNSSDGRLPQRKPGFDKGQVGSIRRSSLAGSRSFGTTYAGDIMAVNLKTLEFSPLSEFLVGSADILQPSHMHSGSHDPEYIRVCFFKACGLAAPCGRGASILLCGSSVDEIIMVSPPLSVLRDGAVSDAFVLLHGPLLPT
jgi:hypothetical protein